MSASAVAEIQVLQQHPIAVLGELWLIQGLTRCGPDALPQLRLRQRGVSGDRERTEHHPRPFLNRQPNESGDGAGLRNDGRPYLDIGEPGAPVRAHDCLDIGIELRFDERLSFPCSDQRSDRRERKTRVSGDLHAADAEQRPARHAEHDGQFVLARAAACTRCRRRGSPARGSARRERAPHLRGDPRPPTIPARSAPGPREPWAAPGRPRTAR